MTDKTFDEVKKESRLLAEENIRLRREILEKTETIAKDTGSEDIIEWAKLQKISLDDEIIKLKLF